MASKTAFLLILPLTLILCSSHLLQPTSAIGVNWGAATSHPLPPPKVVELLKANNITKVKLFDSDSSVLEALSGSNIDVTLGIPNSMLRHLNTSITAAHSWVHNNLTRFVSPSGSTLRVEYIAVGDEPFLESYGEQFYPYVIGAATNIQAAINKAKLGEKVKVVVPCSFDAFQSESNLPSKGHFRSDINKTMTQLLTFLNKHQSPFFATISPFLSYHESKNTSLDFALFRETARPHKDTRRIYKNSYELHHDTLVSALVKAGFPLMDIIIGQIGWPTDGAPNATSLNAETFFKGLISNSGTPLRPKNVPKEIYILSLFDEDERNKALGNFERHWGVFTFDGQAKYQVNFGQGKRKLVNAQNVKYLSSRWCVVNNNKDLSNASARALEACSVSDCTAMSNGGSCFNLTWPANISYAFNSYYQQKNQSPQYCDFGGLGLITTVNPSEGNCRFLVELETSFSVSLHESASFLKWIISFMIVLFYFVSER